MNKQEGESHLQVFNKRQDSVNNTTEAQQPCCTAKTGLYKDTKYSGDFLERVACKYVTYSYCSYAMLHATVIIF